MSMPVRSMKTHFKVYILRIEENRQKRWLTMGGMMSEEKLARYRSRKRKQVRDFIRICELESKKGPKQPFRGG